MGSAETCSGLGDVGGGLVSDDPQGWRSRCPRTSCLPLGDDLRSFSGFIELPSNEIPALSVHNLYPRSMDVMWKRNFIIDDEGNSHTQDASLPGCAPELRSRRRWC